MFSYDLYDIIFTSFSDSLKHSLDENVRCFATPFFFFFLIISKDIYICFYISECGNRNAIHSDKFIFGLIKDKNSVKILIRLI